MRTFAKTTAAAALIALFSVGCAGPENKLGRGIRNFSEFTRMGEFSRSVEQTALWDGPQHAYTTGVIRGLSRTVARTAIGFAEIVTFPIPTPNYEPWLQGATVYPDPSVATLEYPWGGMVMPDDALFPASYTPGLWDDGVFHPNTAIGFGGGDVAPFFPGSRFKVFDH
jgi:putative exosortase-associated protein (TIGR04073 family)